MESTYKHKAGRNTVHFDGVELIEPEFLRLDLTAEGRNPRSRYKNIITVREQSSSPQNKQTEAQLRRAERGPGSPKQNKRLEEQVMNKEVTVRSVKPTEVVQVKGRGW